MKMHWWFTGLLLPIALIAALSGCRTNTASNPSEKASPTDTAAADDALKDSGVDSSPALNPQSPRSPFTSATSVNPPLPVPNLIPPTTSSARSPQSEIGRTDPFAAVVVPPTVSIRATTPPSPPVPASPTSSTTVNAPVATAPLPLPSVQPAPVGINQFPPVTTMPAVPPLRLADAIEISGVVEVGGKTSVIVQVPNERTSRYVYVGDYVSNGNVLVKRVEMGIEPVVVLEEDGAEVTRYVGNGSSLTGLL